jgi:hypothetical protein
MPGFMKDVGHAMAALLIQVAGQLIFAVRSVSLSERVVMATLCDLLYRHDGQKIVSIQARRTPMAPISAVC